MYIVLFLKKYIGKQEQLVILIFVNVFCNKWYMFTVLFLKNYTGKQEQLVIRILVNVTIEIEYTIHNITRIFRKDQIIIYTTKLNILYLIKIVTKILY